jgi:hypothetical protein
MSTDLKALVAGLFDLLEPTEPELRKRAIKAALTMLGDDTSVAEQRRQKVDDDVVVSEDGPRDAGDLNLKAQLWMKRNKISAAQLEHVFHVDGKDVDIIAAKVPGKSGKEQVINAYLLVGIRELLKSGETKFDDKSARQECERLGCHGKTNHATYLKSPGNVLTGSMAQGWALTGPGQTAAAELVKELTAE